MKRKFFAVGLSICLTVLTLFSFVGCGENGTNGTEDLKKQIAELTAQVQTLETALKAEQDKNAEQQAEAKKLQTEKEKLQAEKEQLWLDMETAEILKKGTLYTWATAAQNGYVDADAFLNVAYYHNGGTVKNEDLMGENFLPQEIEKLDNITRRSIQRSIAKEVREKGYDEYAQAEDVKFDYYGCYDGFYVIIVHEWWRTMDGAPVRWESIEALSTMGTKTVQFFFQTYVRLWVWVEEY